MNYQFVDHIFELEKGKRILAAKSVTRTEDYFDEYYPRLSTVPKSVIVEAMASTAALLLFASTEFESLALLAIVEKAVFTHPVYPGDQLILEINVVSLHNTAAQFEGKARVGKTTVASSTFVLGLFEIQTLSDPQMKVFFRSLLGRTKKWMQFTLNRETLENRS